MDVQRHVHERSRQAALPIEDRLEVDREPAQIVLVGGQAHVLQGLDQAELGIAPGPSQLPGQPRMRGLPDGQHATLVAP